jgi:hypothetical protein
MRTITRFTAAVAGVGVAAALAVAAPAQARDTTDIAAATQTTRTAQTSATPMAPSEEVSYRSCIPALHKSAQVRSCIYLHKDGPEFVGQAHVTDVYGGRNYNVMVLNLKIQGYLDGQWRSVANTWKADRDGWWDKRDNVEHKYWGTCTGAGETIPLRTSATVRYQLKSGGPTTTTTRYSPSARFRCP